MHDIGAKAGVNEHSPGGRRLLAALLRQADVHPASEQALGVPFAFTMAQQH